MTVDAPRLPKLVAALRLDPEVHERVRLHARRRGLTWSAAAAELLETAVAAAEAGA